MSFIGPIIRLAFLLSFFIGFIYLFISNIKKSRLNAKRRKERQERSMKKMDKSMRKLVEFYTSSSEDMKLDFRKNLKRGERKGLDRYIEDLELNTAKRVDKLNKRTRIGLMKFYKYFMKVQLESNIRVYNMLKESKQKEILESFKWGERVHFKKLLKDIKKKDRIKFSHMDNLLRERFIRNFNKKMDSLKTGFISLNSAIASSELSIGDFNEDTNWYQELVASNDGIQDLIRENDILRDINNDLNQMEFNNFINNSVELNHMLDQQNFQEQLSFCMNESMKTITPIDFGGYVGGVGFNPSDTMAFNSMEQMNQQMQQMQQMQESMNSMSQDMHNMNQMNDMNHMNNNMHNHHF